MNHIVFEGCGINGMSYIGVIRELESQDILPRITHLAGSSSGAFFATLVALGYTSYELEDMVKTFNIDEVVYANIFEKIYNIFTGWGLYNTKKLRKKLEQLFHNKCGNVHITFSQLYQLTGKFLVISVSDMLRRTSLYINPYNNPTIPVLDILLASISAPIVFTVNKNTMLTDGGITDNYPLWIFNNDELLKRGDYESMRNLPIPETTMGVKIKDRIDTKVDGVISYIMSLFNTMVSQLEHVVTSENYHNQTITISGIYEPFNFTLSDNQVDELILLGIEKTRKFLIPDCQPIV